MRSEAPCAAQPDCVQIVYDVGIELLVFEPDVQPLEERHAYSSAIRPRFLARIGPKYIPTQVVEIDAQIDVVEVVAELRKELHRAERKSAVHRRLHAAHLQPVVAASPFSIEPVARIAEIHVRDLQGKVRVQAP